MQANKTSHELARNLRELADKLDAKPDFALPFHSDPYLHIFFPSGQKAEFLAAAKVLGGVKSPSVYYYALRQSCGTFYLDCSIPREAVCKLVKPAQDAVYECEPLLSQAEEAEIGNAGNLITDLEATVGRHNLEVLREAGLEVK